MLSLEDPAWARLEEAYGSAQEIPKLLSHLAEHPDDKEAWNDAWSSLCHQETIYSASIAATPHLVAIARQLPMKQRLDPLILVGSIAVCVGKQPKVVYGDRDFTAASAEATRLLAEVVSAGGLEQEDLRYALGALAGLLGDAKLANVLFRLDLAITCPNCGAEIEPLESELAS
ncbi:MAG TPA: hypothetical protein VGX92_03655 [Pyrinomonadaceae bacterium]|jgi:hypothetical protein|nr:hypothetical protein [Pyrinomonadaceae bacterium]